MNTDQPAEPTIEYVAEQDEVSTSILNEVFDELFGQIEKETRNSI